MILYSFKGDTLLEDIKKEKKIRSKHNLGNDLGGVYQIKNIINNKIYIGSSIQVFIRWSTHYKELQKKTHVSKHLVNSWYKYGANNFLFETLEEYNKKDFIDKDKFEIFLRQREQEYLDKYQPFGEKGYNTNPLASGGKKPYNYEDLKEGNCPFSEVQFWQIIEELQDPYTSITDLAREMNLPLYIIVHIANGGYEDLCEDIYIPKRSALVIEGIEGLVFEDYENGMTINQISKKYNEKYSKIKDIIKYEQDSGIIK